jgi:hypothetical protein
VPDSEGTGTTLPALTFWYAARAHGIASVLLSMNTPLLDGVDWAPFGAMVNEFTRLTTSSRDGLNR